MSKSILQTFSQRLSRCLRRAVDPTSTTCPQSELRHRESGLALGEVLLLTAPICALSMAVTSRLADTSSRRLESMLQANQNAQRATRQPCPGNIDAIDLIPLSKVVLDSTVLRSKEIQLIPAADVLANTGRKTETATVGSRNPSYHFQKLAAAWVPDDSADQPLTAKAHFVCNEPDDGNSRKLVLGGIVLGFGMWQARKIYGGSAGGPTPVPLPSADGAEMKEMNDRINSGTDIGEVLGGF